MAEIMIIGLMLGLNLPLGVVMILGGLRMRRAESYGLAMTASILAVVPGSIGFVFSLPIGIWSLIVISRHEVKAVFSQQRRATPPAQSPPTRPRAEEPPMKQADLDRIRQLVRGPATGLILVGVLNLLPLIAAAFLAPKSRPSNQPIAAATAAVQSPVGLIAQNTQGTAPTARTFGLFWITIVPLCISLPLSGLLILSGIKMRELQFYGLAICASIAALAPCHLGFILGLPIGAWSLSVLLRADVRAAFQVN